MELLEVGDAARVLGCSKDWVHVLVRGGRIVPIARTRRGVVLFTAQEVARVKHQRAKRQPVGA